MSTSTRTPTKPIDATVTRIDPQATFTPENTYFRDDRVKQVVGVKLQLKGAVWIREAGHAGRWRDSRGREHLAERRSAFVISSVEPAVRAPAAGVAGPAPAIRVVDLSKRYGELEAVRGVTFDVEQGEIFGLIGPDGAGKTSTFQILAGVMEATSGVADDLRPAGRETHARTPGT